MINWILSKLLKNRIFYCVEEVQEGAYYSIFTFSKIKDKVIIIKIK